MFCVHLPNGDCDVVNLSFFVVTAKAEDQNQELGSENQFNFRPMNPASQLFPSCRLRLAG